MFIKFQNSNVKKRFSEVCREEDQEYFDLLEDLFLSDKLRKNITTSLMENNDLVLLAHDNEFSYILFDMRVNHFDAVFPIDYPALHSEWTSIPKDNSQKFKDNFYDFIRKHQDKFDILFICSDEDFNL